MFDLSQIHPVTDFVRDHRSFLSRIKETGNPEVLTVNGKPEYVILDAASYQAIANELERSRLIRALSEGIDDMQAGGGQPIDVAFAEIRASVAL
jgi:PHD/YefM family antitoxin component YafN of YafNO toxin-antitoxin module